MQLKTLHLVLLLFFCNGLIAQDYWTFQNDTQRINVQTVSPQTSKIRSVRLNDTLIRAKIDAIDLTKNKASDLFFFPH